MKSEKNDIFWKKGEYGAKGQTVKSNGVNFTA